jgi:hypothetical protein
MTSGSLVHQLRASLCFNIAAGRFVRLVEVVQHAAPTLKKHEDIGDHFRTWTGEETIRVKTQQAEVRKHTDPPRENACKSRENCT